MTTHTPTEPHWHILSFDHLNIVSDERVREKILAIPYGALVELRLKDIGHLMSIRNDLPMFTTRDVVRWNGRMFLHDGFSDQFMDYLAASTLYVLDRIPFRLHALQLELGKQNTNFRCLNFFPVRFLTAILTGPSRDTLQSLRIVPNQESGAFGAMIGTAEDYLAFHDALQNAPVLQEIHAHCEWVHEGDHMLGPLIEIKTPDFVRGAFRNDTLRSIHFIREPTSNQPDALISTLIKSNPAFHLDNQAQAPFATHLQQISLMYPLHHLHIEPFVAAISQLNNLSELNLCLYHLSHTAIPEDALDREDKSNILLMLMEPSDQLKKVSLTVMLPHGDDEVLHCWAAIMAHSKVEQFAIAIPSAHQALHCFRGIMASNVDIQMFSVADLPGVQFVSDARLIEDETIECFCRANRNGRGSLFRDEDDMPLELWMKMLSLALDAEDLAVTNIYTLLRGNPTFFVGEILPRSTWMEAPAVDDEPFHG